MLNSTETTAINTNTALLSPHPQSTAKNHISVSSTTPSDLLRLAVEQGADLEKLEKLMDLQERWESNQARKAFVEAMAEFKKNPPEIFKTKQVGYANKDGSFTGYMHATLGNVTCSIVEGLAVVIAT